MSKIAFSFNNKTKWTVSNLPLYGWQVLWRFFLLEKLRELTEIGKEGVNLLGISDVAEKIGFKTAGLQLSLKKLMEEVPKPSILNWGLSHFIILLPQKTNSFINTFSSNKCEKITIADPAKGIITIDR